jgi:hypothetical protein
MPLVYREPVLLRYGPRSASLKPKTGARGVVATASATLLHASIVINGSPWRPSGAGVRHGRIRSSVAVRYSRIRSGEHSQDAPDKLTCRLVNTGIAMARQKDTAHAKERTELLGVRVTAVLKTKVKVEAARRGLTIAQLFEEMWHDYREREHAGAR